MKTRRFLFLAGALIMTFPFFAFTCEEHVEGGHKRITFVNESDDLIHVIEIAKNNVAIDDTLFTCKYGGRLLQKGEEWLMEPTHNYWETDFKNFSFIQIFVFSKQFDVDCDDEEKVREFSDKYLLKRYQLTKEDLDEMDWVITYPPK
jgi:hypothetical protein